MLIPFPILKQRYNIQSKGVLHIGANDGAECKWYYDNGVERTLWIEALPKAFEELKKTLSGYPNTIALNYCISNKDYKTVSFNVASNKGESSSMLEFGSHAIHHPDVVFTDKIKLTTIRVDTLLNKKGIDIRDYDFLNVDVQGVEGLVLESMGDMLRVFNHLYIEVNRGEDVYKGCSKFEDIVDYVGSFGFQLKEVKWTSANWGDAYFTKVATGTTPFRPVQRKVDGMVNVPQRFKPTIGFHYPPDNSVIFEKWYHDHFSTKTERLFLDISWTAFHVNHAFGNDAAAIADLQNYVDGLDRSKKYYTIHQFDLGCMVDFRDLDIIVFGMAGGRIDYCLPLLSMPHKFEFDNPKTLFANFIGRRTHPLRDKVIDNLRDKQGCYVSEQKHDLHSYCSIMASSVFGVAPTGFGLNSFRLQESLQYGAIPVIIAPKRLEPHGVPFEEYGYFIEEKDADKVYEILQEKTVDEVTEKQSKLKYYYDNYFTYSANSKLIFKHLTK